jgi:hypothetical protein
VAGLEVHTAGTGYGTVSSAPSGITLPGSAANSYALNALVQLTATPGPGSTFAGWTSSSGASIGPTGQISSLTQNTIVTATFIGTPVPAINLDVDGNRQISALTDGVLLVRYLFGIRGPALIQGALGANATRTAPEAIVTYLDQAKTTLLDVDGNGTASALTDGVMLVRYLFGVRGDALIQGALGLNPHPARDQSGEIEGYLSGYMQVAPGAVTTTASLQPLVLPSNGGQTDALTQPGASLQSASTSPITESAVLSVQSVSESPAPASSTQPTVLSTGDLALSTPVLSTVEGQGSALDLSSAIAATQLATASVQSRPWVAAFLGTEEDEEVLVGV